MPIPAITQDDAVEVHAFVQTILSSTQGVPSNILINGLMSAYFSVAVNRGFAADVPGALRAATEAVEKQLDQVITVKAQIDAQSATKN